jgi:transcription-repair coupling factor (superfamily II helicase)
VNIPGVLRALEDAQIYRNALTWAVMDADLSLVSGLDAPVIAGMLQRRAAEGHPASALLVTPTGRRADSLAAALHFYLPDAEVLTFEPWETLPHERLSPSPDTVGQRLDTLAKITAWDGSRPLVVIASVRAALQPLASNLNESATLELRLGMRGVSLEQTAALLVERAYARVDMVSRRGEFAVRGGILDVFAPTADHPVRVEFFGDEIDDIRAFAVADQRSLPGQLSEVSLTASRELLLTPEVRQKAAALVAQYPALSTMLTKMGEGIPVEGMESLMPLVAGPLVSLVEYLPQQSAVAIIDPERASARAQSLGETNREFLEAAWSAATSGAQAPIDPRKLRGGLDTGDFLSIAELREITHERGGVWWRLSNFASDDEDAEHFGSASIPSFHGNVDGASEFVRDRLGEGWRVVILATGQGLATRTVEVLSERGIAASVILNAQDLLATSVASVMQGTVEAGFQLPDAGLVVLTDNEFYGRTISSDERVVKKLAVRRKAAVDPIQLSPGDPVVHMTHGIGRFVELTKREVSSGGRNPVKSVREYLVLEYAPSKRGYPGDKLYVPTDQLELLSKYLGGESPALSKMGGSDWAAAKGRARKAVRDIAVELVKLYSARMSAKGHAFGPDTPWQRELEEAFPFAETPDQLQTIDEIKADMEKPVPMDRLLSGDVGFGKTEVAVRAAFKAIQDGKQVAMLVPTTLLVKQHLETVSERFAGFPVQVRPLSRFQTDKQATETLKGLADGSIDMVIGTHRILTEKVRFKDLGLLIIDEEQRFGVEHKDALKKLKTGVDILAMSATPIPRTLEMAVTGIREMSTLATPPEDRHPILTFVGARSDKQIAAAIRREILREGQVFFVHNRVKSIQRIASELAELVPEARIAVAHGQMGEHQLEQVVDDFWERRYDVLVSTTIIETGLDIANANTIIIDRADKYGLAQLHQLRGRVGRGRERAYAYFLYDDGRELTETAADRLQTIAINNELGSGMQVALKDLELRGAGNLLGAEQAGHIAGVGFDLYLRMIGEAVATFRGEETATEAELRLELPVPARIPEEYIDSERLRLEAYQKLSTASTATAADGAIELVAEELADRYGAPPADLEILFAVARLRRKAALAGLSEVVAMGGKLRVAPANLPESMVVRLKRLYPAGKVLGGGEALLVPMPESSTPEDIIAWVDQFLTAMFPPAPAEPKAAQ